MKKAIRIKKAWLKSDSVIYSLQNGVIKVKREKGRQSKNGPTEAIKELTRMKEQEEDKPLRPFYLP